jgi:hypothetical protein
MSEEQFDSKKFSFEVLKWPINIFVFELAFGYGLMRLLSAYYGSGQVPNLAKFVSLGIACSLCWFLVSNYLPADTDFFHFKSNVPLHLWIYLSFLLAIGVPFISVFLDGTVYFWACALTSAAIKALYELEELRRKNHAGSRAPTLEEIGTRHKTLYGEVVESPPAKEPSWIYENDFLIRHIYKPEPDAFALKRPITLMVLCLLIAGVIVLILGLINSSSSQIYLGFSILIIMNILYVTLSGASRAYAIYKWRQALMTPNDGSLEGASLLSNTQSNNSFNPTPR